MAFSLAGGRRKGESESAWSVVARPRRLRGVSLAAAVLIIGINLFAGLTLSGTTSNGGQYFPTDRWAVAGLGPVFAALALLPWRFLVQADATHIRVRNVFGDVTIPWDVVARIRFDRKAIWASMELTNGEPMPLLAVQVFDQEQAVSTVRRLRELHAEYQLAAELERPPV